MAASGFPGGLVDDDDEDDFVPPIASSSSSSSGKRKKGSGGLVPSKSTVYVSNIDFALTNSDLYTIFSKLGKVGKVTVVKDKVTRQSKGVAFVLFTKREDAENAVKVMNGVILNDRTLKVSIAKDNGRAQEFIRRRHYEDKSRCYECQEGGHLSYECPRNQLPREKPLKKRKGGSRRQSNAAQPENSCEEEEAPELWASVVDSRKSFGALEQESSRGLKGPKKQSGYFSDESGED